MSNFPKKRWDKMTINLVESFNAWLKNERHHSICTFLKDHMIKLVGMLVKHKEGSLKWKGSIGPKIEDKILLNITKGMQSIHTRIASLVFQLVGFLLLLTW